jgi:oxygen-independent coproporphyrinogen III oxidase
LTAGARDPVEPFALYVHVPWCRHVCPYCDFNVYAAAEAPVRPFVASVAAEVAAYAARQPWAGRSLQSVYLGGGTPSLMPAGAVAEVLAAAGRAFAISPETEVTIEANPGTVSQASLAGYRAAGVTRLSLGAQSFHPAHLKTLGRDHDADDIRTAVDAARSAGLENVSIDLIFAVPGETLAECNADLDAAIALRPEHISAYALTWEPGTPFHAWRDRGRLVPLDDDAEAAMADAVVARLTAAGYERYEISSFARPGFASRHNTSYWDGSEYLGIGPGAHSFAREPAPGCRFSNVREPERWTLAVQATGTGVAHEERLSEAEARGEFCFTGLRRTAGIDRAAFRARFGVELEAAFPHLARLVADGLVEGHAGRVRLTPRGLRFADTVAATFV